MMITFFQVFIVFGVAGSVKSMSSGHHHVFSGIYCFWGSGVRQQYVEWVLVGCSSSRFFKYLLFLGQRGPSKLCLVGTHWMWNLIPHPTSSPDRNLSKNMGRCKKYKQKSSFFFSSFKINKYYFIILTIILLILLGGPL